MSSFRSRKITQSSGDGYLQENSPSVASEGQDDGDDDNAVCDSGDEKEIGVNDWTK